MATADGGDSNEIGRGRRDGKGKAEVEKWKRRGEEAPDRERRGPPTNPSRNDGMKRLAKQTRLQVQYATSKSSEWRRERQMAFGCPANGNRGC